MEDPVQRVAIIGASHWHVPLYLDALARPGIQVVAVSDADPAACRRVADRFGAACHAGIDAVLAAGPLDFAFVFGTHAEMPGLAAALIGRRIPFALEKPCGVSAAAVEGLVRAAAGLFVAVPLVFRLGGLFAAMAGLEGGLPGHFGHVGFRFMAGPASRYLAMSCPWMLDPVQSGGGCAINLAPHLIDMFHTFTGQDVASVAAVMRRGTPGCAVEDHAALLLTGSAGTTGTIETSYTYPSVPGDLREFSFSLSSERAHVQSTPTGLRVVRRDAAAGRVQEVPVRLAPDPAYGDFVTRTLADCAAGRPPIAGLADAARVMRVLEAAYASARQGGAPVAVAG